MDEDYLTDLVEQGYYELAGVDDDGEPLYVPNLGKMQKDWPELYDAVMMDTYQTISDLEDKGYVKVNWDDEENDFTVSIVT